MMEQIRNATKTWLAGIVVGLLVISFAMWGVQDIFTTNLNDPVAVVNGEEVDVQTFAQEYNLTFRQMRSQLGGNLTQAQALDMNLHRDALDSIIRRIVVNQLTDELGLRVSDQFLQRQIISNPAFAGPTGQFEQRTYLEQLAGAGYTPQTFEQATRNDLRRSQLMGTVVSGLYVPDPMAVAFYEYANERREIEYFLLPSTAAGEIADPGDSELRSYYAQNQSRYRAPEYRALTMLRLSVEDLAQNIDIPEEDIETVYEIRSAQYQIPERRDIEQLTFADTEAAQAAMYLLEQGGEFDNVGGAYVDLGEVTRNQGVDEAVMEAAFAAEETGLVGIVEGSLSTSIVRVNEIIPAESTPFEEVRDQIRHEQALEIAGEEIFAISEDLIDLNAGGASLEEIGEQLNIDVVSIEAIDATGRTRSGEQAPAFTGTTGLLTTAFQLTEGEDSGYEDTPEGDAYIVRVDRIVPATTRSFEDAREAVREDWRAAEVRSRLREMATGAAERINNGADFAAVAAELGRDVRTTPRAVRRSDTSEVLSSTLLNTLFSEPEGTAASGPVMLGSGFVVARATEVLPADMETADLSQLRVGLENEIAAEMITQLVEEAQASANVRINENVLNQAVSQVF